MQIWNRGIQTSHTPRSSLQELRDRQWAISFMSNPDKRAGRRVTKFSGLENQVMLCLGRGSSLQQSCKSTAHCFMCWRDRYFLGQYLNDVIYPQSQGKSCCGRHHKGAAPGMTLYGILVTRRDDFQHDDGMGCRVICFKDLSCCSFADV